MNHQRKFPTAYLWILALVLGVGIYLLFPAALPFLLIGGMVFMHLGGHGGHGGHGHGSHQPDPERSRQLGNASAPSGHNHGNYSVSSEPNSSQAQVEPGATTSKAGFETQRRLEETAQNETKPHRGCH